MNRTKRFGTELWKNSGGAVDAAFPQLIHQVRHLCHPTRMDGHRHFPCSRFHGLAEINHVDLNKDQRDAFTGTQHDLFRVSNKEGVSVHSADLDEDKGDPEASHGQESGHDGLFEFRQSPALTNYVRFLSIQRAAPCQCVVLRPGSDQLDEEGVHEGATHEPAVTDHVSPPCVDHDAPPLATPQMNAQQNKRFPKEQEDEEEEAA